MADTKTTSGTATATRTPLFDKIEMFSIHVTDFDRALRFYRDTLGLKTGDVVADAGWAEFPFTNGAMMGIHRDDCNPDGRRPGGATGFYIVVDDVRKTAQELKTRGVTITEDVKEMPFGTTVAWEDPDGNEFVFIQPKS